jgi:hypothetical protein
MLEGMRRRSRESRRRPERRRRRRSRGRRWWWSRGLMRAKALKMSRLGESSASRVVQDLSLLLLAFVECLLLYMLKLIMRITELDMYNV